MGGEVQDKHIRFWNVLYDNMLSEVKIGTPVRTNTLDALHATLLPDSDGEALTGQNPWSRRAPRDLSPSSQPCAAFVKTLRERGMIGSAARARQSTHRQPLYERAARRTCSRRPGDALDASIPACHFVWAPPTLTVKSRGADVRSSAMDDAIHAHAAQIGRGASRWTRIPEEDE
ncbi:hypothetical protein FA95DRAFT_1613959 [Auriscalpium vulgare]|uniref:Uncharacterized protein n=1 Tax=Auriscalpium vulgare TaxID=40419 RepID=A0ACB8R125_9AGAM|nr:hypothetical protein FA95DRAFT_1613959 [Auriscalpium vulgare]